MFQKITYKQTTVKHQKYVSMIEQLSVKTKTNKRFTQAFRVQYKVGNI